MFDPKPLIQFRFRSVSTKRLGERSTPNYFKELSREASNKLSQEDLILPVRRESKAKKTVVLAIGEPSDERKTGNPAEELTAAKDRFKQLMLQQKSPMREIENMLKEQALLRKTLEQQGNSSTRRLKLNIDDRYSDEDEPNTSGYHDNDSVRMLDKWQLENKKRTRN